MKRLRPALRYFGGKHKLAPWIISNFPQHRIYVEPFGGAASVLLAKPRAYAEVYNDLDDTVYSFFKVLQGKESALELHRLLQLTPFSRREFELARSYHPDAIERARRLVIRSFMGFGADSSIDRYRSTAFRSNSNKSGTTPAHDWVNYLDCIAPLGERLMGVVIECRDYQDVCLAHDSESTLHYFDPPYMPETRTKARAKHYAFELDSEGHEALLVFAKSLKGSVVISGYDNELYGRHLAGWKKEQKEAFADGAQRRLETLWIKQPRSAGQKEE